MTNPTASLPPVNILLVDDLEENLLVLAALLRRDDLRLLKARSGREALELLLQHDVALAFIDVQMPEMDGFELAELMRGSERTRNVPIIFVTAGAHEPHRVFEGYDAGAVDFLFKPIDARILRHKTTTFVQLYRQREQLTAQLETIRASEEFRTRMLESSQDAILVLDLEGRLLSLNAKGQERFGKEMARLRTPSWMELWEHPEETPGADAYLADVRRGVPARFQGRCTLPALLNTWWDVALTPIQDADVHVEKVLMIARDVTEQRRLHEELTSTLRLNETFVAVVGHDLRNPLNAVILSADMLKNRAKDPQYVRIVDCLQSSARRMSTMIDELFDLTRARLSGGIPIETQEMVDLTAVAEKVVSEFRTATPDRPVQLRHNGDARGTWDPNRLAQVASNLVGNALRHGKNEGPVVVDIDGTAETEVVFSVSNAGQINEETLRHLFDPFRMGNVTRGRVQGLGLGLFIVQQVVIAHGGYVEATSIANETTFQVRLPRRHATSSTEKHSFV